MAQEMPMDKAARDHAWDADVLGDTPRRAPGPPPAESQKREHARIEAALDEREP